MKDKLLYTLCLLAFAVSSVAATGTGVSEDKSKKSDLKAVSVEGVEKADVEVVAEDESERETAKEAARRNEVHSSLGRGVL